MDVDEVIGLSTFEIFVEGSLDFIVSYHLIVADWMLCLGDAVMSGRVEPCGVNNVAHAVSDEEVFDEICEAFSCTVETLRA
ncbi:unnamed protein product [Taenia asiatica]|uniref:Inosine-uridine preferring nucleoside hydrolase n=1 Tax=Taenia asiatica TaxID=60517 RepID=A0A0R3VZP9_TAEAS|nr:unnamed protein product [Taenia asiatica]